MHASFSFNQTVFNIAKFLVLVQSRSIFILYTQNQHVFVKTHATWAAIISPNFLKEPIAYNIGQHNAQQAACDILLHMKGH